MSKVATAQFFPHQDPKQNMARIAAFAEQAGQKGVELLVLPELSNTGYDMKLLGPDLPLESTAVGELKKIAARTGVTLAAGLAVQAETGERSNISAVVGPKGCTHRYAKAHLFDAGIYKESDKFTPGGSVAPSPWNGWHLASVICFDLRFPELSRKAALDGATMLLSHSAWPYSRREVFQVLARARAIENQLFAVHSNFVGNATSGQRFGGGSCIVAPDGEVLAALDDSQEGMAVAILEQEFLENIRASIPCLPRRRTDLY